MKKNGLKNKFERVNNPGIDLANWERLRKRWADLQSAGHKIKIDFRLVAHPDDAKNILAIDVIQTIDNEIMTETVQRKAGEAYTVLGIAGLAKEGILEVFKEMMHQLHAQTTQKGADLVVTMAPSSAASGENKGYTEKHASGVRHSIVVNYQQYYILNALRDKMMELEGKGWRKVKAVYRSGDLEFYFDY